MLVRIDVAIVNIFWPKGSLYISIKPIPVNFKMTIFHKFIVTVFRGTGCIKIKI